MIYVPIPITGDSSAAVAALFSLQVTNALLAGIGSALAVDPLGLFVISVTPYTYRRRLLQGADADIGAIDARSATAIFKPGTETPTPPPTKLGDKF